MHHVQGTVGSDLGSDLKHLGSDLKHLGRKLHSYSMPTFPLTFGQSLGICGFKHPLFSRIS